MSLYTSVRYTQYETETKPWFWWLWNYKIELELWKWLHRSIDDGGGKRTPKKFYAIYFTEEQQSESQSFNPFMMEIFLHIQHTKIYMFSRFNGDQTDPSYIGLATWPAAARSDNSDNVSSHTALPSLPKPCIQSLCNGIVKQAKKNYGSNYGKRDSSILGLSEGKEGPRKAASVSPSAAQRLSDLSHGDPIASLVAALSRIKLWPKTHQDNKQPSTICDNA
ncbi:hypothetical protein BU17DRAFT_69107 [Hysterangium stoloniferum]|nr:hypothetical protein BU17DRAFT_69107 [Hysterangium stoloniferum]